MNKFVERMLELGAELDKAVSPIEISMVINDAEILYKNHIEQLTLTDVVSCVCKTPEELKDLKNAIIDKYNNGKKIHPDDVFKFTEAYHKAKVEDKISKLTNKHYNRLRNSQGDAECRRLLKEQLLKQ